MTGITRLSTCQCGRVKCQVTGAPIINVVCYCNSCQEAGRLIEALPGAPHFVDSDGGTPMLVCRDDRFACIEGEALLTSHRLKESSPTRRMVASCCNSAMFLKFERGFWVTTYRARFPSDELPPLEMRVQVQDRRSAEPLPDDVPSYRNFALPLILKALRARFAMWLHL